MRTKIILLILGIIILTTTSYFYKQNALDFRFIDEEYNFTVGKYLKNNEKLYQDLITNHQPLAHILSAKVQEITSPNSTYLLVSNHRKSVIIWSFTWSVLIIFLFGLGGLFFITTYELTKIYLLGNLFLAESLIVYPLITFLGLTIFKNNDFKKWELVLLGISFSLSLFSLSPIWPALIFMLSILVLKSKKNLTGKSIFFLTGFLIVCLFIFQYIFLFGYFDILYTNLTYTVPSYQSENWFLVITKSFLSPFLSFLPLPTNPTLWVIRILTLILILFAAVNKNFKQKILLFVILGLTNIRFVHPGTQGYDGFHLLPWYGVLIFIASMIVTLEKKRIYFILFFISIFVSLNFAKDSLFIKIDAAAKYVTNYSTHTYLGNAVKIMKGSNDTFFASPDNWLIYWQSDTNHLPKLFGYYAWMAGVPKYHLAIINAFEKSPPTFFYCDDCGGLDLTRYLEKYKQLKREGNSTRLYVLKEKAENLNLKQKQELEFYKYSF